MIGAWCLGGMICVNDLVYTLEGSGVGVMVTYG
jgi:hypothetical protein